MDSSAHDYSPPDHAQPKSYVTQPIEMAPDTWRTDSTEYDPQLLPQESVPHRRWILIAGRGFVGSLLLVGLVTGTSWIYYQQTFAGRIYPNISVQGVDLSLSGPEQARLDLEARYAPFLAQPLTLAFEGRSWTPTLQELGARLEIEKAVESAFATGRQADVVGNVQTVAAIWKHGIELPVGLSIDQAQLQHYLASLAAEVEQSPVDAGIKVVGTDVQVNAARPGRQLLVDETLLEVTAALQELRPQEVVLRTRLLPTQLSDQQAQDAAATMRSYLQGSLVLAAEGKTWEVTPDEIAQMLTQQVVTGSDGERTIKVTLDPAGFDAILDEIAVATGYQGENPRLDWNGGDVQIIKPGTPGLQIDREKARLLVLGAVRGGKRNIELPFKEVPPAVNESTLASLGINELISVGRSDFSGSAAYRVTNIEAGMRLLHGILLAPGEEFSFNQNIGNIDASNGFVEGYAIIQNRTQLEYGGGICQDSTTMFRAAFWAGLPITERWGHSFYISWYDKYAFSEYGNGPGMDATIFTGGPDLKFVNDTGNWLLIQASANPSSAVAEIRMYGTKPNRTVELLGPEIRNRVGPPPNPEFVPDPKQPRGRIRQSDTARGGMEIYFSRVIVENGVRKTPEEFVTKFKPWPNIYVYNPADRVVFNPGGGWSLQPIEATPTPESTPPADATAAPADGTQPAAPADGTQPTPAPAPPVQEGQPVGGAPEPAPPAPAPTLPPADGQPIGG